MSSDLIPLSIGERAKQLRDAGGAPLRDGQAERTAERLIKTADRVGMGVEEYVVERARRMKVTTANPDVKSAFWSYGVPHPDVPPKQMLSNEYVAAAWAESENAKVDGAARYLEGTQGGQAMSNLHLWNRDVHTALGFDREQGQALASSAWSVLSEKYADTAKGEVAVFAEHAHPLSVLYNTELPALRANPDVGVDNVKFVYPPPHDWPDVARDELGSDEVRARAQVADPAKPLHINPEEYAARPPAERSAVLDNLATDVATADKNHVRITPLSATPSKGTATGAATSAVTSAATGPAAPGPSGAGPSAPAPPAPAPPAPTPVWQAGFAPKPTAAAKGTAAAPAAPSVPTGPGVGTAVGGTGI
ncbi:hypothetical protein [Streptomyces sp. H27-C3]|uniref:hypothetical protein n=1 Tax=Streptomyces sp. H27-C3 TaxID=3046305 RepID=UPI0024BA616A|nr:hypothetical protein [Streptomyces sp. H27-C3]MDJ0464309.1 hypothetical protein [Streptomyces sp. H27-C3]